MPQDPNQLRSIIDPLPVPQDFKATIWDSYQASTTPQQFKARFDTLSIPQEAKAALWDLKFGQGIEHKTVYEGARPVSSQDEGIQNNPLVKQGDSNLNLFETPEQKFMRTFKYAPLLGAGIASTAAGAGRGLVARSLLAGLGGAAGEGGFQLAQAGAGDADAPKSASDAISRMAEQGLLQGGLEFGVGALTKPLEWMIRGISPVEGPLNNEIARLSRDYGLRLTPAEINGSGGWLQRLGTSGLFGQGPALKAQAEGLDAARNLLQDQIDRIAAPTSPQATGRALKDTISQNAKIVSDVFGGRVRQTAGQLHGVDVDFAPLKQWAQSELDNANVVNSFAAANNPTAAANAVAQSLGYQTAAQAQAALPPQVWNNLIQTAQGTVTQPVTNATKILGRPDRTVEGVLKDILAQPDRVPFEVANRFKQDLFELNPTLPSAFKDKAVGTAKTANKQLTSLMEQAVGGTPQGQAWINARGQYRTARQLFSQSETAPYQGQLVQQILKSPPSEVVQKIQTVDDVEALRDAVLKYSGHGSAQQLFQSRDTWSQFQRQYVQGLLKDSGATGPIEVYGLKDRMDALKPGVLSALFSTNPQALNNLRSIAEAMSRVKKVGSVNTLGQTIALHAAAKVGLGTVGGMLGYELSDQNVAGAVGGALAFELIPYGISRMIYNKQATELFIRGLAGIVAESSRPAVAAVGRAGVTAAPYTGSAMANLVRAFQIAGQQGQQKSTTQGQPLPIGSASPFSTSASK